MRSAVFFAALIASVAAQLRIDTPTALIVCQPAKISWSGGTAPYFPAVIPGGQASAAALKSFPQTSDTTLTWTVDIAAGTEVTMRITDSQGIINYAEKVTIQAGSSTACINAAVSVPAGSASQAVAGSSTASASGARASVSSASGAAASAVSSVSASVSGAVSSIRSTASSVSGSVASTSGSASASVSRASGAATSSSAAAYLSASPKAVGGLLGLVAAAFGVVAMV